MKSPIRRFAEKMLVEDDGCWRWIGSITTPGYGEFTLDGRRVGAHRAAYALLVGPIPAGMVADHLCGRRSCVNPGHLELVRPAENTRRWVERSGGRWGTTELGQATTRETTSSSPRMQRRRAQAEQTRLYGLPAGVQHGATAYSEWGCRCEVCSAAVREKSRRAYERRIARRSATNEQSTTGIPAAHGEHAESSVGGAGRVGPVQKGDHGTAARSDLPSRNADAGSPNSRLSA